MHYLEITGKKDIGGAISISGAKNSALPLLAATILSSRRLQISNLPVVNDVKTLLKLLGNLGAEYTLGSDSVSIDASLVNDTVATYDIVKTMRASVLTLGPLTARFGHCEVSLPGGCAIGQRPINLHLSALEKMGAEIEIKSGYVVVTAKEGLKGCDIVFDKITVTGTENILMAAALAHGTTRIINAAKEPEVVQLCEFLRDGGVEISGIGTDELEVVGTCGELLDMHDVCVIPDRIEAGTYLCAGAILNQELTITNAEKEHLGAVLAKFEAMGFGITAKDDGTITIHPAEKILPVDIETTEFPGFPTDMQAQFVALATQAEGVSIIEEKLFENRFMHVSELQRMGADITLKGNTATVRGETNLAGADVMATDLRASSALVLAGLVAEGSTNVHRIYHLDRGYVDLEGKLVQVGADIKRLNE
jgi:UDP-N-acetylglucosamine 1-carboxyvinyltransferase